MKKILTALVLVSSLAVSGAALAQGGQEGELRAAVDLHPVFGFTKGIDNLGFGFDVRGGYAMKMEGFTLMPEGVLGYTFFGTGMENVSSGLFRLMGGARAIFQADGFIPSAFAHIGFGSWSTTTDIPKTEVFGVTVGGSHSESSGTAVIDVGGALDFPVAENLLIGGHAALNFLTAFDGATFLSFGAQGTYRF